LSQLRQEGQQVTLGEVQLLLSNAQERVGEAFRDKARWAEMAILNTARMGKFSSDRTIAEYAREIWDLDPVSV